MKRAWGISQHLGWLDFHEVSGLGFGDLGLQDWPFRVWDIEVDLQGSGARNAFGAMDGNSRHTI